VVVSKKEEKNKGGRPKKYTEAEAMQKKIDDYFKKCDKKNLPYTITGLALALDMDRHTLIEYAKDEKFSTTIKKAKQKVEEFLETCLYSKSVTGVIFNLKNNFGWADKQEIDTTISNRIQIINDLPSDVDEDK